MKKILIIIRTEIVNILSRPTYLILTFGIPVLAFVLFLVFSNISQTDSQAISGLLEETPSTVMTEGYVDPENIIQIIPEDFPEGILQKYDDEAAALVALEDGEISAYYIIAEDIYQTGEIIYIRPDFNPLSNSGQNGQVEWLLAVNLLDGDIQRTSSVQYPVSFNLKPLDPSTVQKESFNGLAFFIPYFTTILFYIIILASSSLLLNSVVKEKQNRVIEVVMLSVSPIELLTGKIIGLGFIGLLQAVIYSSVGFVLLKLSGRTVDIPANIDLPPSILIWGSVFFIVGFMIYASLMAGLGALVPNLREASQATIIVIGPLIIPMLFISIMLNDPHGPIATTLSLFPLTAPVAMMTRLASGGVPLWQPFLAVALSLATAYLVIRVVTGFFRAQTLLSGQEFKTSLFVKALLGKV